MALQALLSTLIRAATSRLTTALLCPLPSPCTHAALFYRAVLPLITEAELHPPRRATSPLRAARPARARATAQPSAPSPPHAPPFPSPSPFPATTVPAAARAPSAPPRFATRYSPSCVASPPDVHKHEQRGSPQCRSGRGGKGGGREEEAK